MRPLTVRHSVWIAFFMVLPALAAADDPPARPGKGMSIIPGDYAEYSHTKFDGEKKKALGSTIMVATGKVGEREGVILYTVKGIFLTKQNIFYDLTQEKVEQGELLETGKESLAIDGRNCDCTWEKRRVKKLVVTLWRCPDLPFEKHAKMQVQPEADDGRKVIVELVHYGPDSADTKRTSEFLKRLKELDRQGRENNSPGEVR